MVAAMVPEPVTVMLGPKVSVPPLLKTATPVGSVKLMLMGPFTPTRPVAPVPRKTPMAFKPIVNVPPIPS